MHSLGLGTNIAELEHELPRRCDESVANDKEAVQFISLAGRVGVKIDLNKGLDHMFQVISLDTRVYVGVDRRSRVQGFETVRGFVSRRTCDHGGRYSTWVCAKKT